VQPVPGKVVFATPTVVRPFAPYLTALEQSVPALDAAGIDHSTVFTVGNPYISCARATMLRKALDAGAETVVFIDHDLSWRPDDLVRLIRTEGDVVAGLYRFRKAEVEYMGSIFTDGEGRPIVRGDGCIRGENVPAGFLKITRGAVAKMMRAYPALIYGDPTNPHFDLFNHGAHEGLWWGEDFALSRRWRDCGGDIWVVPDLDLTHHDPDEAFPGNFHDFLLRQPGGSEDPNRKIAA
jgi:hypothetical protein